MKFLIVVDCQNDFITGSLANPAARAIVPKIAQKIKAFASSAATNQSNAKIIATMDSHGADYLHTQEGKNLPIPHCIKGTAGWQLHPLIAAALPKDAVIIEKPTFGSLALAEHLQTAEAAEFLGFVTDICVLSNIVLAKTLNPELEISLNPALTAGSTPEAHAAAITVLQSLQTQIVQEW